MSRFGFQSRGRALGAIDPNIISSTMAKVMDSQVAELLTLMRNADASVDAKVAGINDVKSGIKHFNVPDSSVAPLFDLLRLAMQSQNATLVTTSFGTLGHLLKRLNLQDKRHIVSQGPRTIPLLLDRLGDQKERHRLLAAQCLGDVWKAAPQEVEKAIRDIALASKNPRTKENSMHWIAKMSKEQGLQFKPFVPRLVEALEDADGGVREVAKVTVVELFRSAPGHAKVDLKKQLTQRGVRKTIVTYITSHLELSAPLDLDMKASTQSLLSQPGDFQESVARREAYPTAENSNSQPSAATNPPPPPENDADQLEPAYVDTQRELDDIFRSMHPCFEGKESEGNWFLREKNVQKIRRLTKGNAPKDFTVAYLAGIKSLLDGILKTVNSLRTTVSSNGCSTIQEIAKTAGPGLDPMVEILLQNLIKLCGGTKKISSNNGNITVDRILANVSYNHRIMQHILAASQDKNVQPRLYASGWLKTILTTHGHLKSHIEHTQGLEIIEKCITKGLADPNPGVREAMRGTYWVFARIWPGRAETIMSALDANSRKLLERDPGNPNSPSKPEAKPRGRPEMFSQSTSAVPTRVSLKQAIAERKRAAAAKDQLPRPGSAQSTLPRPGSAQSSFTPIKPVSTAPGLGAAPVRPLRPAKRTDTVRPVTADPYSRRNAKVESPAISPMKGNDEELTLVIPTVKPAVETKTPLRGFQMPKPTFSAKPPPKIASPMKLKTENESSSGGEELEILTVYEDPLTASNDAVAEPATPTTVTATVDANTNARIDTGLTTAELPPTAQSPNLMSIPKITVSPKSIPTPKKEVPVPKTAAGLKIASSPRVEELEQAYREDWRKVVVAETTKVIPETDIPKGEMKARRLLDSGIAKIRSRTLDAHGFRMLQGLARNHPVRQALQENNGEDILYDIWDDGTKLGELLVALLEYLESPLDEFLAQSTPGKSQDLKMQAVILVKILLKRQRPYFAPYYPRTLCAILTARKDYDYQSHMVSALEEVSEDVVASCQAADCIDPVLGLIEIEKAASGNQTTCMGLYVLGALLHNIPPNRSTLAEDVKSRLGNLAVHCLNANDPVLRRAVVQFCLELHSLLRGDFWPLVSKIKEDHQSLLIYYIAKREKEGEGTII